MVCDISDETGKVLKSAKFLDMAGPLVVASAAGYPGLVRADPSPSGPAGHR